MPQPTQSTYISEQKYQAGYLFSGKQPGEEEHKNSYKETYVSQHLSGSKPQQESERQSSQWSQGKAERPIG